MTASELAAITGLTSGAITGVVARLERSGWLRREPHPDDRRKQVLRPTPEAVREVQQVFEALPPTRASCSRGSTPTSSPRSPSSWTAPPTSRTGAARCSAPRCCRPGPAARHGQARPSDQRGAVMTDDDQISALFDQMPGLDGRRRRGLRPLLHARLRLRLLRRLPRAGPDAMVESHDRLFRGVLFGSAPVGVESIRRLPTASR